MKELLDLQAVKEFIKAKWANSLGYIIAILIGVSVGILVVEGRITEDCRYLKAFRLGSQAFTCVRTI